MLVHELEQSLPNLLNFRARSQMTSQISQPTNTDDVSLSSRNPDPHPMCMLDAVLAGDDNQANRPRKNTGSKLHADRTLVSLR